MGMATAVVIVQRSLDKGKYARTVQFETVRKFRAAASNIYHSSIDGQGAMVMAKETRKLQVTECPTYSDFFERFCKGMHKRMGDIVRPDRALSHNILKQIMVAVERDWASASEAGKLKFALEGAFYLLAFVIALRGEEVPLIEMRGLRSHWVQATQHEKPHVKVTLLGRFKNEIGECYHIMPILYTTPRGLEPGKWVSRVLDGYSRVGIHSGYMFRNQDGTKPRIRTLEPAFHDRLEHVKLVRPDLIGPDVDVTDEYGVSRSFRRGGGTSEATNKGADTSVLELNGRWRKKERSGASRPNISVREHYTDVRLVLDPRLAFSSYL
jgi:hypothetical protein